MGSEPQMGEGDKNQKKKKRSSRRASSGSASKKSDHHKKRGAVPRFEKKVARRLPGNTFTALGTEQGEKGEGSVWGENSALGPETRGDRGESHNSCRRRKKDKVNP